MKNFILKFANWVAGFFILLTLAMYWLTKPPASHLVETGFQKASENTFKTILDKLEVSGFADILAQQKQELSSALEIFHTGEFRESEKLLDTFLKKHPNFEEANYYSALSKLNQGKKREAAKILAAILANPTTAYREDAEWFYLMANTDYSPEEISQIIKRIASSNQHKYQTSAATIMASMALSQGSVSFRSHAESEGGYSILIKPKAFWWQNNSLRYSLMFLLPFGGIAVVYWKKRIIDLNQKFINEEIALQTASILKEKESTERILHNIIPAEMVEELKNQGYSNHKNHEQVSVLFCDLKDYTKISEAIPMNILVNHLQKIFEAFDRIMEEEKLEKIKTVGDCYISAGGLKNKLSNSAESSINAAKKIHRFLNEYNEEIKADENIKFIARIGIHTGPLVSGILGTKKYAFDIWGDTVNISARLEQTCEPGKINISAQTYELVKDHFTCEYRGDIDTKGKGPMEMYYIEP